MIIPEVGNWIRCKTFCIPVEVIMLRLADEIAMVDFSGEGIEIRFSEIEAIEDEKAAMTARSAKENCVRCGKETQYPKSQEISGRKHYIEGASQLCSTCYRLIYR